MAKNIAKEEMLKRSKKIFLVSIIIMALVFVRIIYVQFFSTEVEYNAKRFHDKIFSWQDIPAHRGSIFDRNGDPLAVSIYSYQVMMDYGSEGFDSLKVFKAQSDSLSKLLARYFKDKPAREYAALMLKGRDNGYKLKYKKDTSVLRSEGWWLRLLDRLRGDQYVTVKLYDTIRDHKPIALLPREIDYTEWQELKKWPILNYNMGVTYNLERTDTRIYPHGELARSVIGKLYEDDRGTSYGIEGVYSEQLAAHPGKIRRQRIARGFYGQVLEGENVEPVDGGDVVTTIDINIQDVVSRSLEEAIIRHNGIWGTSMVMDVKTGEILAMANLKRASKGVYVDSYNSALRERYEPGSTFKAATVMALLEEARMSPDQTYDSGNGKELRVGSAKAQDAHAGYNEVDLRTATIHSLNGYFAWAAYDNFNSKPARFVDFLRSLHLDRNVGLKEFGSIDPSFRAPGDDNWTDGNTVPYLGYGYAIELSPLHVLTLYNAIANDGRMVAPKLIKEYEHNGKTIKNNSIDVLNPKICSDKTLNILRSYLEGVATEGTAAKYLGGFKDFKVGAKTATAKVAQGEIIYENGYYLGSMVTYMPADNPKYTIMTAIYTNRANGAYYGSALTGDVQRDIVQYLYNAEEEWYDKVAHTRKEQYPKAIKSGEVKQIEEITYHLLPRTARHDGDSEWGRVSVDSLSRAEITDIEYSTTTMPNVVGMGLKDALFLLERAGLRVSFQGKGAVRSQSIKAGAKISNGAIVSIRLN
ncbi:MAG: penicillin-binding transpeptidase domain-containing protein [Rikenellaceae bacterium]